MSNIFEFEGVIGMGYSQPNTLLEQSKIKKSASYQPIGALARSSLCLKHAIQRALCAALIIYVRNGCDVRNAEHGKRR